MKLIPLNGGKAYAQVDDTDYERLNQYKWYVLGRYAIRHEPADGKVRIIHMHRQILTAPHGLDVDHIDYNGLNNQGHNLRLITRSQNLQRARKTYRSCSSHYKGVHWHKYWRRWNANIFYRGKKRLIGTFESELHAAMAYDMWAAHLFGDYTTLNFKSAIQHHNL
jgi:hypothetical protein